MEDSFFGFDTSIPHDEDGDGRIEEPSEEEYDALNDETFGSAINGDWEEAHESLVRLRDGSGVRSLDVSASSGKHNSTQPSSKSGLERMDSLADADLDFNLSGMKLDDVDINFDDNESNAGSLSRMKVDSSVWGINSSLPQNLLMPHQVANAVQRNATGVHGTDVNPANFLRQNFPLPFQQQQLIEESLMQNGVVRNSSGFGSPIQSSKASGPKISTLEDIERNLIMQQAIQKQQQHQKIASPVHGPTSDEGKVTGNFSQQQPKPMTPVQLQKQQPQQKGLPVFGPSQPQTPRNLNNFSNNMAQHPLGNLLQPPSANIGNRLPPGLPIPMPPLMQGHGQMHPHPFLNQHGLPINFPYPVPHNTLSSPHLPVALNNFAMHPNFNAMRAAAAGIHPALVSPQQQPPRLPLHPPNAAALLNNPQSNAMFNMFNSRLVQEIQQNHPLLQNATRQQGGGFQQYPHALQQQRNGVAAKHRSANGNLPHEEIDEYANLMSTRDKHWLISIQLSQLNTDTPYIDDYYYTMYKEKKAETTGSSRHSQAHKDNQLNHPLTQPRGHAQLILVQLGNKNGARNGQHRERRSSESGNNANSSGNSQDLKAPYVFAPLKFENSLGKLQYGSVTAPRKIIDADIMSGDMNSTITENPENVINSKVPQSVTGPQTKVIATNISFGSNTSGNAMDDMTVVAQRKSRHILLHIETLFRIVLKLEDLDNPNAIATIIMKKKKENERIAALEQLENANKTPEERAADAANPQIIKNKFAYEIESKDVLLEKLVAGLTMDKVIAIMNVRKGKILIRRIMPFLRENNIRWQVWSGVFASLQFVLKKDREDVDGVLYALYPELKEQIKNADFQTIVKFCKFMPTNDKKANCIFCSKFGIASLVCLIIRAEEIFVANCDPSLNDKHKSEWRQFLDDVATSLNRTIQNQTICAALESDCIQPMMNHFARFKDLKLDSLLALITEAKQQIN